MSKKKKQESELNPSNKWEEFAQREEEELDEEMAHEIATHPEELEFPTRKKLEDQLTALERKVTEYKNQALRAHADMENLRRRTERDVANAVKYGAEKLVGDLLPVVDSLIRGLESPEADDPHVRSMREGIGLTLDLLNKTLQSHGVKIIDPQPGEPFNPDLHEAMSMQTVPDAKPNTIIQVVQKGYELNGRVLRAAMVIVAG